MYLRIHRKDMTGYFTCLGIAMMESNQRLPAMIDLQMTIEAHKKGLGPCHAAQSRAYTSAQKAILLAHNAGLNTQTIKVGNSI